MTHPSYYDFDQVMCIHSAIEALAYIDTLTDSQYTELNRLQGVYAQCDTETRRDVALTYRHANSDVPHGC